MKVQQINRKFQRTIPEVVEKAHETISAISPALSEMAAEIDKVAHHVDFEIERLRLSLERAEWNSRSDTAPIKARIEKLSGLMDRLTSDEVSSSITFLKAIATNLREIEKGDAVA